MISASLSNGYRFSTNWFNQTVRSVWHDLLVQLAPSKVLEIGSFEGASSCFVIQQVASVRPLELHCVDTWLGSLEHQPGSEAAVDMVHVEERFRANVGEALRMTAFPAKVEVHRELSELALPKLLLSLGAGYFDMIYVDGSHRAPDVLLDAVLGYKLLRVGGILIFDDYLWPGDPRHDVLMAPKIAIDAFTTVYASKTRILAAPLYQLYVLKLAD